MTTAWKEVQRSHSEVRKVHSWQKGQPLQSPKTRICQVGLKNSKEASVAEQSDKKESERKGRRGSKEKTPVYLRHC